MKNKKTLLIICLILLFIPTFISIAYYASVKSGPLDIRSVEKVDFTDTNGTAYSVNKENGQSDADFISLLISMNEGARAQDSLPEPLRGTDYFSAVYHSHNTTAEYRYYISQNPSEAYFTDPDGKAFYIDRADAELFICSPFAASIYEGSAVPALSVDGAKVLPVEAEWSYKIYSGEYVSPIIKTTSDTTKSYTLSADFALDFSVFPDSLTVTVYDGDDILFDDVYDKISNLTLDSEASVRVELHAKWYESSERSSRGEATYNFLASVKAPASFYLGRTSVEPGEFVVLTAKNVYDEDTISFSSEPAIDYEPVFFRDGEYMRALVPIKAELGAGDYVFSLECGGTKQTVTLKVTPKTFRTYVYTVPAATVSATRTEATMKEFESIMAPIAAMSDETVYFKNDHVFTEGIKNCTLLLGFGHYRKVNGLDSLTYRHLGVDYAAQDGTRIYAVNAGRVIYVGSTAYSGNTVVIEHGLGLKSWYCHLGSTSVAVGDVVTKDQQIGTTGTTGFAAPGVAHIGMSVFDVPVCPYALWHDGVGLGMTNP